MTEDLQRRFHEHNTKQGGAYTARHAPFRLVFYEAYTDKRDAAEAERFFKSGYGREVLQKKIKFSLEGEKENGRVV